MFRSAPDVLRYLLGTVLLIGIAGCRSDAVGPSPGTDEEEDPAPGWEAPPDPGRMAWSRVPNDSVFEVCRLDPDLLNAVTLPSNGSFAIVRYGRLCHVSGVDGSHGPATGQLWSTTKTLGAVLTGAVMYSTRHLPETDEPGTGRFGEFDRMDSWIDLKAIPPTASINPDARVAHVLAMVGYSQDLEHGKKQHRYDTTGSREIDQLVPVIDNVLAQSGGLLGSDAADAKDALFARLGMEHSTWAAQRFGYSWAGSLLDMARVGLLILNGGVYDGERLLQEEYVYNMTHPAFEDGSTSYGYLTWMNTTSCSPRAIHREYPHGISGATDCEMGDCDQEFDVGVWSANGLGGQFIIGHRGLDMVVVGRNWGSSSANLLWQAVLPAVVAGDPVYAGDQEGFCTAYATNAHAPDLRIWEGGR